MKRRSFLGLLAAIPLLSKVKPAQAPSLWEGPCEFCEQGLAYETTAASSAMVGVSGGTRLDRFGCCLECFSELARFFGWQNKYRRDYRLMSDSWVETLPERRRFFAQHLVRNGISIYQPKI